MVDYYILLKSDRRGIEYADEIILVFISVRQIIEFIQVVHDMV